MKTKPQQQRETNGYLLLIGYLGVFLIFIGIITLAPLLAIPFDGNHSLQYIPHFLVTGMTCITIGLLIYFLLIFKRKLGSLVKHQDAILILTTWIMTILISAIPLATSGISEMNFLKALYEMVSGYTTTGTTIMTVDTMPLIFLLQRVLIQAFGGIGLILVITTAFTGTAGAKLFKNEGHGDTFLPNLAKTARIIILLYLVYIVLGTSAFLIAGMDFFGAMSLAIACISTGGFSVVDGSIYTYHHLGIEIIAMVLMIIGATSFYVHLCIVRGRIKKAYGDRETVIFILACIIMPLIFALLLTPRITGNVYNFGDLDNTLGVEVNNYWQALRYTSFQVISAITTTGLTSVKLIGGLPEGLLAILCFLTIVGGSSGSTSGGIKVNRIIIITKGIFFNITEKLGSQRVISTHFIKRYGEDEEITPEVFASAISYAVVYIAVISVGMIILAIANPGFAFGDSFFEAASLTGGMGMGILIGPGSNIVTLVTSMLLMFFGRLEIIVIFIAFYRGGKDILSAIHKGKRKLDKKRATLV